MAFVEAQTVTSNISQELEPCLEILETSAGETVGRMIPITGQGVLLGRGPDATVRLDDESLSREHARVSQLTHGVIELVDLGSTNGTFLNGQRVQRAVLRVGDRIRIGRTLMQFVRDSLRRARHVDDVLATAHIAMWDCDPVSGRFSASYNFAEVTGIAPSELTAGPREAMLLVHPEDRARVMEAAQALRSGTESLELELRVRSSGGYDTCLSIRARGVRAGESRSITGSATNITARKRAERELRRVTRVLENLHDAIVVTDLEGRITDWTAKAQATFQGRTDAAPARLHDLIGSEWVGEMQRAIAERGYWTAEIPIVLRDKAEGIFEVATASLKDDQGWMVGYIAALRDVTARKAMQEQLVMADKLAAIGSIAAGVAHEINNPLAVVTGGLDWIAERIDAAPLAGVSPHDAATVREVLGEMKAGVARIAAIVAGMKNASKKDDPSVASQVPLRRALEAATRILANEVRHSAALVIAVPDDLWIPCSETRLTQVFIHLLANAVHAIEERRASGHEIRIEIARRTSDSVSVALRDTGVGMSQETLSRLFTPFFSTKPNGKGSGLGLSVTRTILESCGGRIRFESRLGEWTTAYIELPTVPPPAPAVPVAPPEQKGKRGTILVIDDEPFVAAALARLLRSRGFQTEVATDGRVGLDKLLKGKFQAVVCDLMMPEFSGVDLYHELEATAPALLRRLVFLSGGAFTPRAEDFVQEARRPVLAKPWKLEALVAAIEEIDSAG